MQQSAGQSVVPVIAPDPGCIRVPRRHGEILIEPTVGEQEKYLLSIKPGSVFDTLPEPWKTLSRLARKEFLESARAFARATGFSAPDESQLAKRWIVTGHQVEFYHAGVWAKVLFAAHLARRTNSAAFDLLVDHDVVETMGFGVPCRAGGRWLRETIAWSDAGILPAEFLQAPGHEIRKAWMGKIRKRSAVFSDALGFTLHQLDASELTGYTPWMSQARRRLELKMDVHVPHVRCSDLCSGTAWAGFVLSWIRHADAWTTAYNSALNDYRRIKNIKNSGQPMPNLETNERYLELPFWIYSQNSARQRLLFDQAGGKLIGSGSGTETFELTALMQGDLIGATQQFAQKLIRAGLLIRPRALTLTLFIRLLVSDLFIHGIGGAIYDQITDEFMKQTFGVLKAYSCVSAGWLLELSNGAQAGDVGFLRGQKHHLLHNPQLIQTHTREDNVELIKQRSELITEIETLLQADREKTGHSHGPNRKDRADKFQGLHRVNGKLIELRQAEIARLDQQIAAAQAASRDYAVTHWREYYFAMHSFESLEKLKKAL